MQGSSNADNSNRKRGIFLLIIAFSAIGTAVAVYFIVTYYNPNLRKANDANRKISLSPLVDTTKDVFSLQEEIALLNMDSFISFDNVFRNGRTSKRLFTDYFTRTIDGYSLNLKNQSFITTPTYYDSCLFVSGGFSSKEYYSFNAFTGKLIWGVNLSDDGPSSAVIVDSLVIFNSESCTVFALNRFTGKQVWSKWIGDPLLTHLITDGKSIYTAYPSMTLHDFPGRTQKFGHIKPSHVFIAMDAKTGKVKWQRWIDGDIMTTPILCDTEIYLTTFSGTLYKINKSDGKILNAANLNGTSLPTVNGEKVYLAQLRMIDDQVSEAIIEIDRNNFKVLRTLALQEAPYLDYKIQKKSELKSSSEILDERNGFASTPMQSGWEKASKLIGQSNVSSLQNFIGSTQVINEGKLYSCFGDKILCLKLSTGENIWTYKLEGDLKKVGGHLATLPIIIDNYLVTVTLAGEVLLINKNDGTVVEKHPIKSTVRNQPILVKGNIYVPTVGGKLTCIVTGRKEIDGWTMFMKNNSHNIGNN